MNTILPAALRPTQANARQLTYSMVVQPLPSSTSMIETVTSSGSGNTPDANYQPAVTENEEQENTHIVGTQGSRRPQGRVLAPGPLSSERRITDVSRLERCDITVSIAGEEAQSVGGYDMGAERRFFTNLIMGNNPIMSMTLSDHNLLRELLC